MADIYTERDDAACNALAQRLAAACQGVADPDVLVELVAILGEFIGHYPIDQRASLIVRRRRSTAPIRSPKSPH